MAKLWAVIKREYLERVRTKWFVIATLFGPLLFGGMMILPAWLSVRSMKEATIGRIHVVDASGSGVGVRVLERLRMPASLQSAAVEADLSLEEIAPAALAEREDSLVTRVQRKELTGYLVLDSATVSVGRARYAGRNASSIGENERVEAAVRAAVLVHRAQAAGVDSAVAASLTQLRVRVQTERITDQGRGGSGTGAAIFGFGVAFLLYMSLILYGQNVLRGVLEEKTSRVAEVIVSSVKPDTLLAGKVIGVVAVGLTQQTIWIGSGVLFWKQRANLLGMMGVSNVPAMQFPAVEPLVLVSLLLFFVLGTVLYSALFAAVGAMVNSLEEAQQASQPVLLLLIASIIFAQPVMTNPSSQLAVTMSLLPFSAPVIMPIRMATIPVPPLEIVGAIAGVAAACAASIWVAARIYRVGLLMYGKRPTLRELARWVRQA